MHSPQSRREAQQRADDIRVFRTELSRLESEGALLLLPQQREQLDAHHDGLLRQLARQFDIDRSDTAQQLSMGMRIASFLGALALAASVIYLFYQYWGLFGETAQVALLAAAPLLCLGVLAWLQGRQGTHAVGDYTKVAALVGVSCFVLDLVMLGQIFNITPTDRALLAWAALAFVLAYACDLRLLLAVGICCVIAWVSARVGEWGGLYWLDMGQRPENFFPVAVGLYVIPSRLPHRRYDGFDAVYRVFGLLSLLLPVLVLSHWGDGCYLNADAAIIEGAYQVAGFVLSALAIVLGTRRMWRETTNTGTTFFVIFLYTKFYDWWWAIMPKWMFFMVVGLSALLLLVVLRRLRGQGATA